MSHFGGTRPIFAHINIRTCCKMIVCAVSGVVKVLLHSVFSHVKQTLVLWAQLSLFLRSLVDHKAVQECSFRPVLCFFIMKLLFSSAVFCAEKALRGFDFLSAAFWPTKEAGGDRSRRLCQNGCLTLKLEVSRGVVTFPPQLLSQSSVKRVKLMVKTRQKNRLLLCSWISMKTDFVLIQLPL